MRFKHFLLEQEDPIELKKYLDDNCNEFLLQSDLNNFLIRSVKQLPSTFTPVSLKLDDRKLIAGTAKVRKDRIPSGLKIEVQEITDKWFNDKFGVQPRSQGLFCNSTLGNRAPSKWYGEISLAIFPIGKFKVVWSPKIADLYSTSVDSFVTQIDGKFVYNEEQTRQYLDKQDYRIGELNNALDSNSEIMLIADEYLLINYKNSSFIRELREYLK